MSRLPDLIYTSLVETLRDCDSCMDKEQAHAICLAISRAFSPDRPDSITAGKQIERDRTLALIDLRLDQLKGYPRERAELQLLRTAITDA